MVRLGGVGKYTRLELVTFGARVQLQASEQMNLMGDLSLYRTVCWLVVEGWTFSCFLVDAAQSHRVRLLNSFVSLLCPLDKLE